MNKYEIKSKMYCPASRRDKSLFVIVNIAIILMVIYSVASMVVKGIKVDNISGCIVAIVVGFLLKSNNRSEDHYEFCVLSIIFQKQILTVTYLPNINKEIDIIVNSIRSLEYSNKLECLRIVCNYQEREGTEKRIMENSELLLYIPYDSNSEFYQMLEKYTKQDLIFVDRNINGK